MTLGLGSGENELLTPYRVLSLSPADVVTYGNVAEQLHSFAFKKQDSQSHSSMALSGGGAAPYSVLNFNRT